tara:strand:+ start:585 stop:1097 length:513 start_codon:yes stop_codon:yes gene_type:complete
VGLCVDLGKELDMKKYLLLLLVFLFWNCEDNNDTDSQGIEDEVDISWILVRTPTMYKYWSNIPAVGYYFYYTESSNVDIGDNLIYDDELNSLTLNPTAEGNLVFNYNVTEFSFDISDSFNDSLNINFIVSDTVQRIIYKPEMSYATVFDDDGFFGIGLNTQSPNSLIDYR